MHKILFGLLLILCACSTTIPTHSAKGGRLSWVHDGTSVQKRIAQIEASSDGRIGLSAFDTADQTYIQFREGERFPFCSTFKTFVASAVLKKSVNNGSFLKKRVRFSKEEVVKSGYAPITGANIATGMTVAELCAAALQYSDNAAANLLMKELGGPQTVTSFMRSMGDHSFRLDRWEPQLNSAIPGEILDTTTPAAMTKSLYRLALGDGLSLPLREQLQTWLKGNTTGNSRIRAGIPRDWIVGDKTGTCSYGTTNDIGIIWPPNGNPIVVTIFYTQNSKDAAPRNDVIAEVTRALVEAKKK